MRLLSRWRNKLHQQILFKKLADAHSLPLLLPDKAKTAAIIYDATKSEDSKVVEHFAERLRRQGKRVTLFAYYNTTKKIAEKGRFFTKKDVNWKGIPSGSEVNRFLSETFDVMYATFLGENLPLSYMSALCKAHFKIGYYNPQLDIYNLMVSTPKNDLLHFLKFIDIQVTKITKNQDELSAV